MTNSITVQSEMKKRTDLIYDEKFRLAAIEYCKLVGITAKEFNDNKAGILMLLANQVC